MIVLGIDPGISSTGIAYIKDGQLLHSDTIKVPNRKGIKTFSEKMGFIVHGMIHSEYECDAIYVEQTFYKFKHAETSHHKFCGIVEYLYGSDRVRYIAPTTVKLTVTGSGKGSKEEIQKFVDKKFCTTYDSPDEADAIAIAYAGYLKEVE